ncbi:DUF6402 family protein [Brenneria sp. g21c3]|uniref:DUF6402 family protein n=1 Tax=Brenneria sp. g21c3 TaxID=3093893 RepID=UPI002E9AEED4|nr:DUF6402 family protein [Brenneria sp. g21c3]
MGLSSANRNASLGILDKNAQFIVSEAKTKLKERNASSSVEVTPLQVTEIPAAMRKMGWKRSAKLLDRWFSSPAWAMPESWKSGRDMPKALYIPSEHCDEETIKMSWVLNYPRVKEKFDELITTRAYSPAGLRQVVKRLKALGWDGRGAYTFGRYNIIGRPVVSAREMEQYYQNNFIAACTFPYNIFDTLDDMYGALGTFNLKTGLLGTAFRDTDNKVYFDTRYIGVYVKDTFEFINNNGSDQFLGVWTDNGILTRGKFILMATSQLNESAKKYYYQFIGNKIAKIHNSDFQHYRDKNNKGGDFVILSDVLWIKQSGRYRLDWD